jgi:thiosulfate/3-mercaptopyruvate sulfurtransferase
MAMRASALIAVEDLAAALASSDAPVILDASCHLASTGRSVANEFCSGPRVPEAKLWDINEIAVKDSRALPHMLPTSGQMAAACSRAGIVSPDQLVVVYDTVGVYSAARLWWQLSVFGHRNTCVLQGGLPAWVSSDQTTETSTIKPSGDRFITEAPAGAPAGWILSPPAHSVRSLPEMTSFAEAHGPQCVISHGPPSSIAIGPSKTAPEAGAAIVIDARSSGRFAGDAPEPRPGLPSGHIPGSISVPFTDLYSVSAEEFVAASESFDAAVAAPPLMLDPAELVAAFERNGVDPLREGPIISTCGSGVTAAVLVLGLHQAGRRLDDSLARTPAEPSAMAAGSDGGRLDGLFDGSWTEYAAPHTRA